MVSFAGVTIYKSFILIFFDFLQNLLWRVKKSQKWSFLALRNIQTTLMISIFLGGMKCLKFCDTLKKLNF